MYNFTGFLLLLYTMTYAQPEIIFKAQPERVEIGDSVVVSWQVSRADMVYLTNYGRVEPRGQLTIVPEKANTALTLLVQGAGGLATASVAITARGGRGDVFPNEDQFRNEYQYDISPPSLIELLDGVHVVLQTKMGFVVKESYDRHSGKTVFVTMLAERRDWVKNEESGIRARKLAYWVEVEENKARAGSYWYRVKALIQYQRRKENKWRDELQQKWYLESAGLLRQNLQLTLGKGQ